MPKPRTTVETFLIADDPTAPAEPIASQPVRSVPHKHGSDAALAAAREALIQKGYLGRTVSFGEHGIVAYVAVDPKAERFSSRRRPRVSHRRGGSDA
jgi:hypothetical protein